MRVTYNTAILANEKGFKDLCNKCWIETKEHILNVGRDGEVTFPKIDARILPKEYVDEYNIIICDAPTLWDLQKWLRERHDIHVNPNHNYVKNGMSIGYNVSVESFKYKYSGAYIYGDSYESVLEEGIVEGLKLIK